MTEFTGLLCFCSILLLTSCKEQNTKSSHEIRSKENLTIYDHHVHIMSPELVSFWKDLGIPFSKDESHYTDVDSIFKYTGAQKLDLIGMAYVFGSEEYYQGDDRLEKTQLANDHLFVQALKHPDRVRPFFSVDPLQEFALEEIERCISKSSNSGLKLHFNASQVYLTEPNHLEKVKPIFVMASKNKLPVLLHFDNWHPKFGKRDIKILADSILKDIDPITLTIAHFGTSGGYNNKTKTFLNAFIHELNSNESLLGHDIRFDISAVVLDKDSQEIPALSKAQCNAVRGYIDSLGLDKVVFGSDYPLYGSQEYLSILKNKLGLTDSEIEKIQHP